MQTIRDPQLLNDILESQQFVNIFQSKNLKFRLVQYKKGEVIHSPHNVLQNLLFVIEGKIQVYGIRKDGTKYAINSIEKGGIIGEGEFCKEDVSPFCLESLNEVLCLSLGIEQNRSMLEQDPLFLKFLLKSCVQKLISVSKFEIVSQSLEEKILLYLHDVQPDHTLYGINSAVAYFRCSRRQLQRVLVKLCEEGKIQKTGKGVYSLIFD